MSDVKKILIISSDRNLKDVLSFCFDGWGYEVFLQDSSKQQDIEAIKKILPDVIIIDIQSARKEQLNVCRHLKDDFATAFIPIITLINKRQLRSQLLNLKQGVDDYLIKPPDPLDLRIRIEMVMRRSEHSIHASSLTGLPGGKILEDSLGERIKSGKSFSFGYLDVDNFKCFNDVYGYQRGDRVILQTAYMLSNTLKKYGNLDDFVGHIGGDDFAFITTPDKYEKVCRQFIQVFDDVMPFHYSSKDRDQGFLMARDRARKIQRIPLMSISIAIVNKDPSVVFKNTIEVNDRIVEIKKYLKMAPVSNFMADRRDDKMAKYKKPQLNEKAGNLKKYKPLGQILLEKNVVSFEQLDEALSIHWKKGIILGEMLKELGYIDDGILQRALLLQKTNTVYSSSKN